MKECPYCREQIAPESTSCKFCHSALSKKCPFCAEQIPVDAKRCVICKTDLGGGPAPILHGRALGEDGNILNLVILSIVTCGIYLWVWIFKMAREVNQHSGQEKLNPGMDLLLTFATCGIWHLVMCYKYAKAIHEMELEEGQTGTDNSTICLVLAFFVGLVSWVILQDQLNKHWALHRGGGRTA